MRVAQVGNFGPPASTENELRKALEARGHDVAAYQENTSGVFVALAGEVDRYDVVVWTRTGWQPPVPHGEQRRMLARAKAAGVPSVAYHLDRWWGLAREREVVREPFFRCDVVCTADGGHDDEWARVGVNHVWFPPAVSEFECVPAGSRDLYRSDVAFVGSWGPGYHREDTHRPALIQFLRDEYGDRVKFWPRSGQPAIRGEELRRLIGSVKVFVGDSCLVGSARKYTSDRVPETLGRGGFLVHPAVEGVTDGTLYTDREHLATWPRGDWSALRKTIDAYLDDDIERERVARAGREHVLATATYTSRIAELERLIAERFGVQ